MGDALQRDQIDGPELILLCALGWVIGDHSAETFEPQFSNAAFLKLGEPSPLITIEIVSPGTESTDNSKRDYEHRTLSRNINK